ncbi:hypothetical protein [Enterococcus pallens]|uniref:Phage protein n=1 Tax=Enterococcus pallens ATCC BAA-351 TaxID=1158607 RepID=R2T080_9ENTE|nr:hypothetical protein [Enterococcus pallens]EOH93694.1 hypothetical protein UAU_02390 [Enterococcus pallens ATCC BAA-351]EOU24534.1 hypothetical protein I588_00521 [Enterococcus pallens ATCC BAA-351]
MNQTENTPKIILPGDAEFNVMPLNQQLAVRTDTLRAVQKMNRQLNTNNTRQILTMDALNKVSSISLLELELCMQNEHAKDRLKYIADYFTFLCAQDLL